MEILSNLSEEILVSIGSFLTIIAAVIGYFFNRRQEHKKHYKKFLFSLLEIWSLSKIVVGFDETKFIQAYKNYLIK